MTDRDALTAAIRDRPDDDTPRLVYADWLDDHNEPERAAFVRVQVELARTSDPNCLHCWPGNECCYHELRRREWWLWGAIAPEVVRSVRALVPDPMLWQVQIGGLSIDHPGDRGFVVRRGLVGEVRLSLADFVGGACGRCGGTGLSAAPPGDVARTWPCPDCDMTGRVPGLARELFAAHPLTRVVLSDREPVAPMGDFRYWNWLPDDYVGDDARFAMLPGKIFGRCNKEYPTRNAAITALSDALVSYGRELAGLRPLTAPTPATRPPQPGGAAATTSRPNR